MENEYLSSEEEILDKLSKVSDQEGGGSVLYVDEDNEAFCWNREGNTMFIGETGCGKTFSGTLPALFSIIQNREGFISIDTKLDHIKYTYEYARLLGYEMYILNFTNPMKSDTIDLFDLIHGLYTSGDINKKQVAIEILEDMVQLAVNDAISKVEKEIEKILKTICDIVKNGAEAPTKWKAAP